jgi:hypothetical protein
MGLIKRVTLVYDIYILRLLVRSVSLFVTTQQYNTGGASLYSPKAA